MDINATLFGQTIAMVVFVWACMKWIWPPLLEAIEERQKRSKKASPRLTRARKRCRRLPLKPRTSLPMRAAGDRHSRSGKRTRE